MVQALHKAGIRVVLDVVYNHTFNTAESNFERTVPGYFYRQAPDGGLQMPLHAATKRRATAL